MASATIELLGFLLPGFIAAWVFFGLSAHPKPAQFERLIQAFIYTGIVKVVTDILGWALRYLANTGLSLGRWTEDVRFGCSVLIAVLVGLLFAFLADRDILHYWLRKLRITQETSSPNEWTAAFSWNGDYVVLHLPGERRLYGYPRMWPSDPELGHVVLRDASWLLDGGGEQEIEADSILIPAACIELVEFVGPPPNQK